MYVDSKAGGQVNYFNDLGLEWWSRWQRVDHGDIPPAIDYTIYRAGSVPDGAPMAFSNSRFAVVRLK